MKSKIIKIKDINDLLKNGKTVYVKTLNNEYTKILEYVDKGMVDTYKVELENGMNIKVSYDHRFFTNAGWMKTKKLIPNKTEIFCEDITYSSVKSIDYLGKGKIVDIMVNHPDHCYFGNKMLNHNTGKSLLGAHILAEVQKKGGQAVFIDTENAVSAEFLTAIGVDISKMLYCPVQTLEDVYTFLEAFIVKIREADSKTPIAILIDTISGVSTRAELAGDYDKEGWATDKAIINSKAMRKLTQMIGEQRVAVIFTTQLRANLGSGFGEKYTTSGGYALPYHASIRIRLTNLGQIKDSSKNVIGMKTKCKVIKNRIGPPLRTSEFLLYFESGIDKEMSLLEALKSYKIIDKSGRGYIFTDIDESTGKVLNEVKFQSKTFREILEKTPKLKEKLYNKLYDIGILKYRETPPSIDEITIEEIPVDEL